MSSHFAALDEALLVLPEVERRPFSAMAHENVIREALSAAHARVRQQAQAGEEAFRVAFALQDNNIDNLLSLAISEFTQNLHAIAAHEDEAKSSLNNELDSATQCMRTLQAQAAFLVAGGDISGAVTLLCALLDWDEARNDALLGLAICAVRMDRYDAALTLALDYLKRGGRHPRAQCIAGLCCLKNGDRRAAQNHLAIAARAARANPAFRDELRAAQRLLIMVNFGG